MKQKALFLAVAACAVVLSLGLCAALLAGGSGGQGPSASVDSLAETLARSPDDSAREAAAAGLFRAARRDAAAVRENPGCMQRLVAALADSSGRVRVRVISTINRAIGVRFNYSAEADADVRRMQASVIQSYLDQRGLLSEASQAEGGP